MARNFSNWLQAYCDYTSALEAPDNVHFFCGVSAIAGALQRHVSFPMGFFDWYPNFYILIVGKAGLITKSTSIDVAIDILRDVPGIHIGPSALTWQALVQHMSGVAEAVEIDNKQHIMSCLTLAPREFGTLVDFTNRELIDVLVDLWDGRTGSWEKLSKSSGMESITNPWINIISGTTPAWLTANVPETAIGGGFASRCLFVYGREKRHFNAYPARQGTNETRTAMRDKLVADLETISLMKGQYTMAPDAYAYGEQWYHDLWTKTPEHLQNSRIEGYLARKQTHLHKLAMVFAAAQRDELVITLDDFQFAEAMLTSLEDDMLYALDRVGRSKSSLTLEQFKEYVAQKKACSRVDAIRFLGNIAELEQVNLFINQAVAEGAVSLVQNGNDVTLIWLGNQTSK